MVRQDRLESLASPNLTETELLEARCIVNFISEFTDLIRPRLQYEAEGLKRAQAGIKAPGEYEGDPYMDISPDLDDPVGIDNHPKTALNS